MINSNSYILIIYNHKKILKILNFQRYFKNLKEIFFNKVIPLNDLRIPVNYIAENQKEKHTEGILKFILIYFHDKDKYYISIILNFLLFNFKNIIN